MELVLFLICIGAGVSSALTGEISTKNKNQQSSEILLSTSFEEPWVLDKDGDYKAPPGWDVDGICKGYQWYSIAEQYTHYWSDIKDNETPYDLSHSGVTSACIWWSDGYREPPSVGTRQDEWLITPTLDFSRYVSINLSFWSIYYWDPGCVHFNYIKVSTDNGKSWEIVADLVHDPQWRLGGNIWENFNYFEYPINIDLSQYAGEPSVKIAWHYLYQGEEGGRGIWVIDDVKISGTPIPDVTPPALSIEKPRNALYISNEEIFPFFIPVIVGYINVTVNAVDNETGISYVEFLVDSKTKAKVSTPPYVWEWREFSFGPHTLQVKAFDKAGNFASKELVVWKFF
ncbi:MAG: hypothetical protein DRN00_01485 [Thermoplasmata archaeon]|nr:MAG: hypothetical protein DRN00_01485 [Thermoplasmata archaeon]